MTRLRRQPDRTSGGGGIKIKVRHLAPDEQAKAAGEDPFKNGQPDLFNFQNPVLAGMLKGLHGDAATLERVAQAVDQLATIFGTARAKPVPGENGYADYVWTEALGAELREAGFSLSTGAGPGAMEAPMRGHAHRDAELDMKAGRSVGWQAGEPTREGANIVLEHEQAANVYISEERLSTYSLFMFRMQFLFRDNVRPHEHAPKKPAGQPHISPKIGTPGGFGTIAELFTYVAMRSHGQATEPLLFGAHDDFFRRMNTAFMPFMSDGTEKSDLGRIYRDPKTLVREMQKMPPTEDRIDHAATMPRMRDDLEKGLVALDGKADAVAFFGGSGPRTQATAALVEQIAEGVARAGKAVRVDGSAVADAAVIRGAQKANPDAEIQAFALNGSAAQDGGGVEYTRVHDLLVLRQLMNTNLDAIVTTPEGAKEIAMLFTAATDMQTGKMEKKPIIVLDPDGRFEALKEELGALLLSSERQYIKPEDLDLFTVVKDDPAQALRALNL